MLGKSIIDAEECEMVDWWDDVASIPSALPFKCCWDLEVLKTIDVGMDLDLLKCVSN